MGVMTHVSNIKHVLRSPPAQRQTRRWSDFRCAAFWSPVVWRAKRGEQYNRVCHAPQPIRSCRHSRLW